MRKRRPPGGAATTSTTASNPRRRSGSALVLLWLSRTGGQAVYRWGLAALSVVFLIPDTGAVQPVTKAPLFHTRVVLPTLFCTNLYRHYLHHDPVLTVLARLRLAPMHAGGLLVYDVAAAWAHG